MTENQVILLGDIIKLSPKWKLSRGKNIQKVIVKYFLSCICSHISTGLAY